MAAPNDIFVGNCHANTTEEEIREKFCVVGTIKNVRILVDKETGRPKGYAFVEYASIDSVNAAIRLLNGTELHGRLLKVSHAAGSGGPQQANKGPQNTQSVVQQIPITEAWDILNTFKGLIKDRKAQVILETYPQLVNGLGELEKRLGVGH